MGGSPSRKPGEAWGAATVSTGNGMPKPKGQQILSKMAQEQGKPDPFADPAKPAAAAAPTTEKLELSKTDSPLQSVVGASGAIAPVSGPQTAPVAPAPVAQTMLNATPAGVGAGGYGSAPAANPVSMPVAAPQAAVIKPATAAAAQANQTTTGANQFTAPNMNGITFGGS